MSKLRLSIAVAGRPAPQGSKRHGEHGQMREASVYLPSWRAAVKRAVYEQYKALGVKPDDLPYLHDGPVGFTATFWLPEGVAPGGPPDLDKLLRSTWDALTSARVWKDDGQVTVIGRVTKRPGPFGFSGADIEVWEET